MLIKRRTLCSLLLLFFFSSFLNAQDNPPQDVTFVVGTTVGAPVAGTNFIKLAGLEEWNVRLYRGRLKQSMVNDGSGIFYIKNFGSDTLFLNGDTWHAGELVQLEFYKPNSTIAFCSDCVVENVSFAVNGPSGTPIGSPGTYTDNSGWTEVASTKKAMGNGYFQFVPVAANSSSEGWISIYDDYGNNWEVNVKSTTWGVNYNGVSISSNNSLSLAGKYVFLARIGTTISLQYATTATGARTTLHTFTQPIAIESGFIAASIFNPPIGSGLSNSKISGQSTLAAGPMTQLAQLTTSTPQSFTIVSNGYIANGGGSAYSVKRFSGDGYAQFRYVAVNPGYTLYASVLDLSGNDWNIAYEFTANTGTRRLSFRYNGVEYGSSTNAALFSHFFRFYRVGSTIIIRSCATENGVYATVFTYTQGLSSSSSVRFGGGNTGYNNGASNIKLSGQTLAP